MRERGPGPRRPAGGRVGPGPARRPTGPPPLTRGNVWQIIAIVALIAATAGWTTAILLAVRSPTPVAIASVEPSLPPSEPEPTDGETVPPVADTHDAPELEALLPTELDGITLQVQSWTGDTILTDDAWSTSVTGFLTSSGKTQEDLRVAQAFDPTQALDGSVGVYHVDGLAPTKIHDALIAAWKVDFPDMAVTTVTLAGKEVTKCDFGEDTIDSYLYVRDDVVFDIETTDQAIAEAAIAGLPKPGATPKPGASGKSPAASARPSASAS